MTDTLLVHGTAVAIDGEAVLLRGPSGAGKSDLGLRLIDGGADLVADDQALLRLEGARVMVHAPDAIAGMIEVRGVGIVRVDAVAGAPLALIVDLLPSGEIERLPEPRFEAVLGIAVPLIATGGVRGRRSSKAAPNPARVGGGTVARYNRAMRTKGGRRGSGAAKSTVPARVLLVTGMSGAGRSTALKTLEDLGYETFDNLPASLVPELIESSAADVPAIAVGADTRTRGFTAETMLETLAEIIGRSGRALAVLFIDCDDERLERRYTDTRRPHPLAGDRSIMDGIRRERQVVSALRHRADLVIDTSALTPADLKRVLTGHFALDARGMHVFVTSFAYRNGVPRDADLIFDVRFLDNPYYVDDLRTLTGHHPAVAAHIERDVDFAPFFDRLWRLLRPLLPRYEIRGKTYLTIAIGCTGGRHRSVYVAERLAARLCEAGWRVEVAHRDLPSHGPDAPLPMGASAAVG